LDEAEERRLSAFFILLAAAEVRERWSEAEEAVDAEEEAGDDAGTGEVREKERAGGRRQRRAR
jgi:hypothetical protein